MTPREILFIDDQWCEPDGIDLILALVGELQSLNPPYRFHYETARCEAGYALEPALARIRGIPGIRLVILDVSFGPRGNRLGLDVLDALRVRWPTLPVVMLTSVDDDRSVIERAMELGANEYISKSALPEQITRTIRLYAEGLESTQEPMTLWGNSPEIRRVRAMIARVALADISSVLITGESGTGKELVARAIHRQGGRARGPLVVKNCAFDSSELLDSELFGHEKGAFTGAIRRYTGRIERAHRGVFFLDEISSMPLPLQGKLLRVLEQRQFERLGGTETIRSDFQLLAATNEPPEKLLQDGRLRLDLYHRISQVRIEMPPLRGRRGDVELLAELFLRVFKEGRGASFPGVTLSTLARRWLRSQDWPGNVRELRNTVERMVLFSSSEAIDPPAGDGSPAHSVLAASEPSETTLPQDPREWEHFRLRRELELLVEARRRSQSVAQAMRRLFPRHSRSSTAALSDAVRRLTKEPWGDPGLRTDPELRDLFDELESPFPKRRAPR